MGYTTSLKNTRKSFSQRGEKNTSWKGDKAIHGVTYHNYVRRRKPKPKYCQNCGVNPPYDLSFLPNNKNYTRNLEDYEWLCRKCHMRKDGRMDKLIAKNKSKGRRIIGTMVCSNCGKQMRQMRIGKQPIGYGYSLDNEYLTAEVNDCVCGNIVLEEYRAKRIDRKYAQWILRNKGNLEKGGEK